MPVLLATLVCAQLALPGTPQIRWERSLDAAVATATAEGRPLLLAVNMDGESASERIVRELYKDPAFVEHTRPFVCVVASVFRHTPRDRDDLGRRIPCPRLGEVTCGEHIALEPAMYDRWLGGERIAPRHALILADGTKHFDLSLLFDLAEVDRALVAAAPLAPPAAAETIAREPDALDALAALVPHAAERGDELVDTARQLHLESELVGIVRERVMRLGPSPSEPGLGDDVALLEPLAALAPPDVATRTLLLSYVAFPNGPSAGSTAADELASALHALTRAGLDADALLAAAFAPADPGACLAAARALRDRPAPAPSADELPPAAELEERLGELDERRRRAPDDPVLRAELGRATLALARRRVEEKGPGIELLLEDARAELGAAAEALPDDVALLLDAARASYLLADFAEQERLARLALARAATVDDPARAETLRVEALRWLGDAAGRQLAARAEQDAPSELAGLAHGGRALMDVVLSSEAGPTDWVSLASFFAALGRWREETAFALEGLARFPDDEALHQALHRSLSTADGPRRAADVAHALADEHQGSASCAWFAGYADMALADWQRREEAPNDALATYARAQQAFARALELQPAFADSVQHYVALASLGRGFAYLLMEGHQQGAADELVTALQRRPAIAGVRDGLDREALDLLDGALEWRASGPSNVVQHVLMMRLEATQHGEDTWPRAIADAMLREGLRAEGRNDMGAFDEYMMQSLQAGRRALALDNGAENRLLLAQSATVMAESMLARNELDRARSCLRVAGPLLDEHPPMEIDVGVLSDFAAKLRARIGDPRPIARPGR